MNDPNFKPEYPAIDVGAVLIVKKGAGGKRGRVAIATGRRRDGRLLGVKQMMDPERGWTNVQDISDDSVLRFADQAELEAAIAASGELPAVASSAYLGRAPRRAIAETK